MTKENKSKEEKKEIRRKKREESQKKGKNFFSEFKTFITRGNIIDMSIGVIVGTAFSKITTTLTNKIFMPWIAFILGDININEIKTVLRSKELNDKGEVVVSEIALMWGEFLQVIIDFLLIAFVIFITVKVINRMHLNFKKAKEKIEDLFEKNEVIIAVEQEGNIPVEETALLPEVKPVSEIQDILIEIRDLLKKSTDENSK